MRRFLVSKTLPVRSPTSDLQGSAGRTFEIDEKEMLANTSNRKKLKLNIEFIYIDNMRYLTWINAIVVQARTWAKLSKESRFLGPSAAPIWVRNVAVWGMNAITLGQCTSARLVPSLCGMSIKLAF
jgi:hypothetical protein